MKTGPAIGCALLAAATLTLARTNFVQGQAATGQDNVKRGAQIAAEGTPAGAPACVSCHAVTGNPDGSGTFPRIFGQPRGYLIKQLNDYASGRRPNEIMTAVAQSLSDDDRRDVSAYYAEANEPFPDFPAGDPKLMMRGRQLAEVGDDAKAVPACNNCHGVSGTGLPPAIPALAGQFAPYISGQLMAWKEGKRTNDGGAQMAALAKRLTEQDFAAVAAYYQQVLSAQMTSLPPSK